MLDSRVETFLQPLQLLWAPVARDAISSFGESDRCEKRECAELARGWRVVGLFRARLWNDVEGKRDDGRAAEASRLRGKIIQLQRSADLLEEFDGVRGRVLPIRGLSDFGVGW